MSLSGTAVSIAMVVVQHRPSRQIDSPGSSMEYSCFSVYLCYGRGKTDTYTLQSPPTDHFRNMFLAAGPYFQRRFSSSDWLLAHFQSAILTTSTVPNMAGMLILTHLQENASYPKRIVVSLLLYLITFALLALSTVLFLDVSANGYFAFLLLMVFTSSVGTAFFQNGLFAFVSGFGSGEYTQGIMVGQGIAGVLPCVVQIISVLSVRENNGGSDSTQESPKAAFVYFLTATGVSAAALAAFLYLLRQRHRLSTAKAILENIDGSDDTLESDRKQVGLKEMLQKTQWFAMGVFFTFALTMMYPVFTQEILSVQPSETAPRLFQPACFIPLGFLLWNAGDLIGRSMPLIPRISLVGSPKTVLLGSVLRGVFIPLYLLCNLRGQGAVINSDLFYLLAVQLLFGLTNGYLGSTCMMAAPEWVEESEREAAGSFMGLCLVGGLTFGSVLSFAAAQA